MAKERDDNREALLKDLEEKVRDLLDNGSKSGAIWDFLVKDPNNGYWALLNRSARSCWKRLPRAQQEIWGWQDLASAANVHLLTQKKKIQDKDFEWKPTGSLGHWLGTVVAHVVIRKTEQMTRDAGMVALAAWHEENRSLSRDELRKHEQHIMLVDAIQLLPDEGQKVMLLLTAGKLRKEIAKILGCSEGKISKIARDAIARLKSLLASPEEEMP